MQSQPNGAVSAPANITVDRNERRALIAAIDLRLGARYRGYDFIAEGDREGLADLREYLEHVFPLLDQLDWWDHDSTADEFTIEHEHEWLSSLIAYYEPQIVQCIEQNREQLGEVMEEGRAAFEPGGSYESSSADPESAGARLRRFIKETRELIDRDTDELAGIRSIRDKLSKEEDR